ncbi:MAG: DUF3879 family protein [Lachnospiraceae bacterium]|jgi:hypothetical protein|nr:DUF3879 family protein [Lachnospiraceae bacterium]
MRIDDINQNNYANFSNMFGVKTSFDSTPFLSENITGTADEQSIEEINARLVRMGYAEEGMIHQSGDNNYKKDAPVSKEIRDTLIATVQKHFVTNANGTSTTANGDEFGAIMKGYRKNITPDDRRAVTYTMNQIIIKEGRRLTDFIKANDPNWDYGKPIRSDLLEKAISSNSFDIRL